MVKMGNRRLKKVLIDQMDGDCLCYCVPDWVNQPALIQVHSVAFFSDVQRFFELPLMPVLFFGENLSFFPLDCMACSIGMNSNAVVLVIISDCPLVFFQSGFKSPACFSHIRAATLALHPIYHTFDFFLGYSLLYFH